MHVFHLLREGEMPGRKKVVAVLHTTEGKEVEEEGEAISFRDEKLSPLRPFIVAISSAP